MNIAVRSSFIVPRSLFLLHVLDHRLDRVRRALLVKIIQHLADAGEARQRGVSGAQAICWRLLTNQPVTDFKGALEKVAWYRQRWTVEDYHHGLKTGCRLEQRQLQSYQGLRRLLGFIAPVALRLFQVRWHARQTPDLPAVQVLPQDVVRMVALKTGGSVDEMTIEQCWKKIAQLGGYLGRKGDGPPGWKTLWHGWLHLQDLWEGAQLAIQLSLDD